MGATRMIWSRAAREKFDKELDIYLEAALFTFEFEHTDVLRVASDNIGAVIKDLTEIKLSTTADRQQKPKDDVSSIINECRVKVLNELQNVCDNDDVSYNKQCFKYFLVHFKPKLQGHLYEDDDTISTGRGCKGGTGKKKGKAPQLTKLELQQQKDDEKKLDLCLEKQETVKQLKMDYQKTVVFMERFILTKQASEAEKILKDSYKNIINGYDDLYDIYKQEEEDKWYHLDVSSMVKEYKSKVEKELKEICDKVSVPTIKEAFSRHLADVSACTIPAQNKRPQLCNNVEKRMSSKQKKSVIRKKKKKSRGLIIRPASISVQEETLMRRLEFCVQNANAQSFRDHHNNECCNKNDDYESMYGHLMESPPKEEYPDEYTSDECFDEMFVKCDDMDDV